MHYFYWQRCPRLTGGLWKRGVATSAATYGHFAASPNLIPNKEAALPLETLRSVFGDAMPLHRFPHDAAFDLVGWTLLRGAGSRTQAKEYARAYHRPGAKKTDMCADERNVLSFGAPPGLVTFPVACFVPVGERGRAAWRYAHEAIASLHGSMKLPCHVTLDPSVSMPEGGAQLRYIFDRSIGRSWTELSSAGVALEKDRPSFPVDESLHMPLVHHILITTAVPTPKEQLQRVALCIDWEACSLPPPDAAALEDEDVIVAVPPDRIGDAILLSVMHIRDQLLSDVEQLLDVGLVHLDAPAGLCVEALLYSYLFTHHQAHFASRLDRVFALDGGRCAELLVAAADRAFPGGDYGLDEWERMYADPIVRAARAFVAGMPAEAASPSL